MPDDILERSSVKDEGIALTVNGLLYGEQSQDPFAASKNMIVPKEMEVLVSALHGQSQLLALPADSRQESIHSAYGADLALLTRYRAAFKQTLEAAVRARADESHIDAQAYLNGLVAEIGDIDHNPKLDLGPDVMKLEPTVRLSRLQQDFKDDVEELKQALVIWLHAMTEAELVSAVEWLDSGHTAVKYHFFRAESVRTDLGTRRHDPGMHLVGRHVTTRSASKVEVFTERRTHTVVDAKSHALDAYTRRVPQRIARLVDSIPPEVRQFVTIIDGNLSKEEVHRKTESSKVEVQERSVWVDDPTPALFGTWALAGWGGTTPEQAASLYRGHATVRANKWLQGELIALVVCTGLAMFEGTRAAAMVAAGGLIIIGMHQLGMRLGESRDANQS